MPATALPTCAPAALRVIAAPAAVIPETVGCGVLVIAFVAVAPPAGGVRTAVTALEAGAGPIANAALPTALLPEGSLTR